MVFHAGGKIMKNKIWIVILIILLVLGIEYLIYQDKALRFVRNMGTGWNLGNTFDVKNASAAKSMEDFETYWGNPSTTKKIIDTVREAGFRTIRIPITWSQHMDEFGTIDTKWLQRVRQVVDYAIEDDMYVIINLHHDDWYEPTDRNKEVAKEKLTNTWEQIATCFRAYDEHLLFEAMNEPRWIGSEEEWSAGNEEAWRVLNELNNTFVNTIRKNGGMNLKRYLLLPTYCANTDEQALASMSLPKDKNIIVSVHFYKPYLFAMKEDGEDKWNAKEQSDTKEIDIIIKNLDHYFIKNKIPVIIGEYGARDKNNEADRADWAYYVVNEAKKRGILCIWWDTGGQNEADKNYALLNRYSCEWWFPDIVKSIMEADR